jgi:hypothetical protein
MTRCSIIPMPRTEIYSCAALVVSVVRDGHPDLLEGQLKIDRVLIERRGPESAGRAELQSMLRWAEVKRGIAVSDLEAADLLSILVQHLKRDAEAFAAEKQP